MRKVTVALFLVLGLAVFALAQQKYPNISDSEVVLDNEKVVVQKVTSEAGKWAGEHSHSGNQLAVVLDDCTMVYKEDGKETEVARKKGEVLWVDATKKHDHMGKDACSFIIVTLK